MRLLLIAFVLLTSYLSWPGVALAVPPGASALLEHQIQGVDTRQIDRYLEELNQETQGYLPELSLKQVIGLYKGGDGLSPLALLQGLLHYLFKEVLGNGLLLAKLLVMAILAALLHNLQAAFTSESNAKLAYSLVYLVLVGLAIGGFALALGTARGVIDRLTGLMLALLPTLLGLLMGLGGATTAAIFHPTMLLMINLVAGIVTTVVFPMLLAGALIGVVGEFNPNYRLGGLAKLLQQYSGIFLGLAFTVFLGVITVKGAAGAVADGLTLKAGKFVSSTFVPVVGKQISDATELVIGSSLLLKNAVGFLGAGAIILVVAFPLLKIFALTLIYRLAAALVQPVGGEPVVRALTTMGNAFNQLFASVAVVAFMFFIGITVVVGAANLAVMLR